MSKSPNRLLGIVLGVVYLLVGMYGFFLTSSTGFAATAGPKIADLFEVNPLYNLVHLVVGIALLITALAGIRAAKAANVILGVLFVLAGIAGLLVASPDNSLNVLAINGSDNVVNFATAVLLLVVGIGADRPAPAPKLA